MSIPKVIYQTFKSDDLPLITRWHIKRFRENNKDYQYEFYDDHRIESFFLEEFGQDILSLYKRLNIGAAKADMFRYAILLKRGGIYLDIDSNIKGSLNNIIQEDDQAIISLEKNPNLFVQWALIYAPNHPFLKRTLDKVIDNIKNNSYPNDVHKMTGPSVYTEAINECLAESSDISYRVMGTDYNGRLKFKYRFSKFLYNRGEHWKKKQLSTPVLKDIID